MSKKPNFQVPKNKLPVKRGQLCVIIGSSVLANNGRAVTPINRVGRPPDNAFGIVGWKGDDWWVIRERIWVGVRVRNRTSGQIEIVTRAMKMVREKHLLTIGGLDLIMDETSPYATKGGDQDGKAKD